LLLQLLPLAKKDADAKALRGLEVLQPLRTSLGAPRSRGAFIASALGRVDLLLGLLLLLLLVVA